MVIQDLGGIHSAAKVSPFLARRIMHDFDYRHKYFISPEGPASESCPLMSCASHECVLELLKKRGWAAYELFEFAFRTHIQDGSDCGRYVLATQVNSQAYGREPQVFYFERYQIPIISVAESPRTKSEWNQCLVAKLSLRNAVED